MAAVEESSAEVVTSLHVPRVPGSTPARATTGRFRADPRLLHAGEGNQILDVVMGEHSVLLVDEDAHRRVRGLLMPAFNGAALRGYHSMIADRARTEVTSWKPNTEIAMLAAMNRLRLGELYSS